jgi:hypothetical protein
MANLSDKILPSTINSAVTLANSAVQPGDSFDAGDLINALPAIDGSALTSLNSSSLSGALPAIDGSNLTGIPVGAVTAGLAVGAVGTYALCRQVVASTVQAPGATLAGSGLYYTSAEGNGSTTAPSGTWRIMGAITSGTQSKTNTSVWMRIS